MPGKFLLQSSRIASYFSFNVDCHFSNVISGFCIWDSFVSFVSTSKESLEVDSVSLSISG